MSGTLLAIGSAAVIVGTLGVLATYLYIVGSIVAHIADTLDTKIAAGALEMTGHAAEIAPAAGRLRGRLAALARLR